MGQRMHARRTALGLALGLAAGLPAQAADPAAGRVKAAACVVCHGQDGVGLAPNTPHLAGQPAGYLAAQLAAFRSGQRHHEVMSIIAKPLTDADIADLAAWFASFEIQVRPRQ